MNTISIKNILKIIGLYISYMIGAAVATGQEIMQYFTVFGIDKLIYISIVNVLLLIFMQYILMGIGLKYKDSRGLISYNVLFGKKIGAVVGWFVPLGVLCCCVVMLSGSGSTLEQFFGVGKMAGCIITTILIVGLAVLGFKRIFNVLGYVGLVLIATVIIFAIIVVATCTDFDIASKEAFMETVDIPKAADNWFMSAINYSLFGVTLCVQVYSTMGSRVNNTKEIFIGVTLANIIFYGILCLISIAMLLHIETVWDSEIPFASAVEAWNTGSGKIYAALIVIAVVSTLAPSVWECLVRIGPEKSKQFYIAAVVIAILGIFGSRLPFASLVNIVYPIIGYLGIPILIACIVYIIRVRVVPESLAPEKYMVPDKTNQS